MIFTDDINTHQLRELVRALERKLGVLEDNIPCCGMSLAQCHAMVEIGRAGSISLIDLSKLLNLDNSTMSRTVNNLVNNQMAERELDPNDRRYVTIKLTAEGKEASGSIEAKMEGYFSKILSEIPSDKQGQVLESLNLLLNAISETDCCSSC